MGQEGQFDDHPSHAADNVEDQEVDDLQGESGSETAPLAPLSGTKTKPADHAPVTKRDDDGAQVGMPRTVLYTGGLTWTSWGVGPVYDLFGDLLPAGEELPCSKCGHNREPLPPSNYIRICRACQPAMFQEAS